MKQQDTSATEDHATSNPFEEAQSPYGRIPLPVLALCNGMQREDLLNFLMMFSIVKIAKTIYRDHLRYKPVRGHPDEDGGVVMPGYTERTVDDWPSFALRLPEVPPVGFDMDNPKHRAIGAAMHWAGLNGGSIDEYFDVNRRVVRFLKEKGLAEGHPNFDVALTLLSASENRDLRAEDFKVLFAVNSCIGAKKYATITRKTIALRTAGAKDQQTLEKLRSRPLTERQVEYSLSKLQRKGFFHRVLVANRFTFIAKAKSLSEAELVAIAKRWKQKRKSGKALMV